MKTNFRFSPDLSLYLVLDPSLAGPNEVEKLIEDAVRGGVTLVQIREKKCSDEEFLHLAQKASSLLQRLRIPLIINDRVDIALKVRAQGVHVGQSDQHWTEARRLLGPEALIGVSVENLYQAQALEKADIDYLGVSSVFPTSSKADIANIWGLEGVRELRELTKTPLVGIGGIDTTNIQNVLSAGADGAAVVSAICSASRPEHSARQLRKLIDDFKQMDRRKSP